MITHVLSQCLFKFLATFLSNHDFKLKQPYFWTQPHFWTCLLEHAHGHWEPWFQQPSSLFARKGVPSLINWDHRFMLPMRKRWTFLPAFASRRVRWQMFSGEWFLQPCLLAALLWIVAAPIDQLDQFSIIRSCLSRTLVGVVWFWSVNIVVAWADSHNCAASETDFGR